MSIPQGHGPVTPAYITCVFCINGIELLGDGPCDVCIGTTWMSEQLDPVVVVAVTQRLRARITA